MVTYLVSAANGGQGKCKGQENWVQPFKPIRLEGLLFFVPLIPAAAAAS